MGVKFIVEDFMLVPREIGGGDLKLPSLPLVAGLRCGGTFGCEGDPLAERSTKWVPLLAKTSKTFLNLTHNYLF